MNILQLPSPLRRCIVAQYSQILKSGRGVADLATPNHSHGKEIHHSPLSLDSTPQKQDIEPLPLNSYTISPLPNKPQLRYASSFFRTGTPQILYSASTFRSFPPSPFPEVAFLGRSNVGKSSLLNALFGRTKSEVAHVSKKRGRTKTMNGFGVPGTLSIGRPPADGDGKERWRQFPLGGLIVVDMPGYGSGSREIWGREALKYLEQRKQLRRTFILIDAEVGLKQSDITVLTHLRRKGISHQIVLSKADKRLLHRSRDATTVERLQPRLMGLHEMYAEIRERLDHEAGDGRRGVVADILCCSAEKSLHGAGDGKIGIDELRWAVLSACGMESDGRGQRRKRGLHDIDVLEEED